MFNHEKYMQGRYIRGQWESLWQDCYDYALPQRGRLVSGLRRGERLYDATALDATDQLASLLLGNITPPLSPWFGLKPGVDITEAESAKLAPALEKATRLIQAHFDQSNFIVELHQSLLDLIVAGTACLAFEESDPGELSAFHFTAIPLTDVVMMAEKSGALDTVYRPQSVTLAQFINRYPDAEIPLEMAGKAQDADFKFDIVESYIPRQGTGGYIFTVTQADNGNILYEADIASSPFINFRWMKSPGEIYGRSPVMKALPDIKTANKVVELILKNASISVTGIWQAEDDGVLNPATIELVPGAIIPKAVGSKGLTPLEMPSRFDVSQLVLEDLRNRIRHALLSDALPQFDGNRRTATEIMERSADISLLLGATFGRLQVELLNPLIQRAYQILRRRGAIPDLPLDGRIVAIDHRSPLARSQSRRQVQAAIGWLQTISTLGPEVTSRIDHMAVADYLTGLLGIPAFLKPDSLPVTTEGDTHD